MRLSKHLDKGFWAIATNSLKAVYGLFFTIWLISVLPEEAWGTFYLIQVTFIIISQLGMALSMHPYIKFYYGTEHILKLQSNALLIYIVFLLLALGIILPFKNQLGLWLRIPDFGRLINFVPLLLFASFGKMIANEICKATHRLKEFFISEALYFTGNVAIILTLYFQRGLHRPADLLFPMSISYALSSLVSLWMVRSRLKWGFRFDFSLFKRMFDFGKYLFGTVGTSSIFQYADIYVIGLYLNPAAVGLLAAVKVWAHGFQIYRQAMGLIVFPALSRLFAEQRKDDFRAFYEKGVYYSSIVLFAMVAGLVVFSDFLFETILQKYPEGAALLRFFALTGVFVAWQVFGESVLFAAGKPNKTFYARLATGLLNLALNFVLVKLFGIWGAIIASVVSLAILAIVVTFFAHREVHFTIAGILKRRFDLVHFVRDLRDKATPPL
jgi:O-antigen/teichoic acid export membrane protein